MALTIISRCLSWVGRRVASCPVGPALFDRAHDSGLKGDVSNIGRVCQMGRHEALTAGQVPVCRSVPAFGASAPEQVYTFATAAVKDSAGAAIKDGSTKRRESRASLGRHSVGRGTQAPRKPGKPKESGFLWAGVAEEFYLQIKGWPVDVDLTDKLKDGRVAGMPIDAKLVQAVLHLLANGGKSSYFNHAQSAKKGEGAGLIAPSLFAAKARVSVLLECNPEDAKRALNLFKWWQGRHPKTPQLLLLRPLIRALERGSLHTDVEAVWKIYKVPAIQDDYFVVDMCTAFFYLEMYDAVLAVYQEAIHTRSVIAGRVNDVVVQAICAKHASAEEIWAYYKELVNRTGWVITVPGYVALLEAGVTVEQIRSLKYKQPDRMLHRLICALTFLSQNHEVGVIANELIQDNQPMRDSDALVLTLTALVYAGFETGAQRLAELQTEKHGVRLDKALESKISDRHSFALAGINSYELMSTLEGPHQTSLPVQAALILHCYFPLKDTDKMWQAYQLGKGFDGNFDTTVMRYMLYALTAADRISNAEEVLADYFKLRRDNQGTLEDLGDGVFTCFFEMYMKAGLPEKVVDMVRRTLDEAYRVKPGVLNFWVVSLNEAGFRKEGEQIDVATGRSGKRRQMGIPGFGWSGSSTMDKSSKGPLGAALRSR